MSGSSSERIYLYVTCPSIETLDEGSSESLKYFDPGHHGLEQEQQLWQQAAAAQRRLRRRVPEQQNVSHLQ